jgi:hypothetical protein
MGKKNGKYLEWIVELFERSIQPNARIERDVLLSKLHFPTSRKAQCDIVIREGDPPRETLTIIEVQDRATKTKINDFRGWLKKREQVGAQHLICVSKHDFSRTIKEEAAQLGNEVRLVKLTELPEGEIPTNFFKIEFTSDDFLVLPSGNLQIAADKVILKKLGITKGRSKKKISGTENIFSRDKKKLISINKLCQESVREKEHSQGQSKLIFSLYSFPRIFIKHENEFIRIGLKLKFEWKINTSKRPIKMLSYEQDEFGELAWIIETEYPTPSGPLSVKVPVKKIGDQFQLRNMYFTIPMKVSLEEFEKLKETKNNPSIG